MKIHLGCGNDYKKGYVNIDSSSEVKQDKVWNLEKTPLPFKENSVDEVLAFHVLENVHNFIPLMHDLHRVCRNGAVIKVKTPFYSSWGQFNDPTHVRFFSPFTFGYFEGKNNYSHQVKKKREVNFKVESVSLHFGAGQSKIMNWLIDPFLNLNHRLYCRFFAWKFPAAEIEFQLRCIK